jgi:WD40 repeat protein
VVTGEALGYVKIYNLYSLSLVNSFQGHQAQINRIKQSPFNDSSSNYVATCSDDKTVRIWNVYSSSKWFLIRTYSNHSSGVYALEWLDTDTLASSGLVDQTIKIWSMSTGQTKLTIKTNAWVESLKLLSSSTFYLAAGLSNGEINIYNLNDDTLLSTLNGHRLSVNELAQLNLNTLASSSSDKTVRIWDLTINTTTFILRGHTHWVYGLKQVSLNILASGSTDRTIILWNVTDGTQIKTLKGQTSQWSLDLINNGGKTLISGSSIDQTIKLWNWETGELLNTKNTPYSLIQSLAVIRLGEYFKFPCLYIFFPILNKTKIHG